MNTLRYLLFSLCLLLTGAFAYADDAVVAKPININTADAQTLSQGLKGVGPSKAKAIIAYRESYGAFKSVDELTEVKGIGQSLLTRNRDLIVLE